jgi:hypothetical protein
MLLALIVILLSNSVWMVSHWKVTLLGIFHSLLSAIQIDSLVNFSARRVLSPFGVGFWIYVWSCIGWIWICQRMLASVLQYLSRTTKSQMFYFIHLFNTGWFNTFIITTEYVALYNSCVERVLKNVCITVLEYYLIFHCFYINNFSFCKTLDIAFCLIFSFFVLICECLHIWRPVLYNPKCSISMTNASQHFKYSNPLVIRSIEEKGWSRFPSNMDHQVETPRCS